MPKAKRRLALSRFRVGRPQWNDVRIGVGFSSGFQFPGELGDDVPLTSLGGLPERFSQSVRNGVFIVRGAQIRGLRRLNWQALRLLFLRVRAENSWFGGRRATSSPVVSTDTFSWVGHSLQPSSAVVVLGL